MLMRQRSQKLVYQIWIKGHCRASPWSSLSSDPGCLDPSITMSTVCSFSLFFSISLHTSYFLPPSLFLLHFTPISTCAPTPLFPPFLAHLLWFCFTLCRLPIVVLIFSCCLWHVHNEAMWMLLCECWSSICTPLGLKAGLCVATVGGNQYGNDPCQQELGGQSIVNSFRKEGNPLTGDLALGNQTHALACWYFRVVL